MLDVVTGFVDRLRHAGLRVSTAEAIDAARAVTAVGLDARAEVHAALGATLCKRADDRPVFDELFDAWFGRVPGGAAPAPSAVPRGALADLSPLARHLAGEPSPELPLWLRDAAARVGVSQIESPLQAGMFAYRILDELGLRAAEAEAVTALGALEGQGGGGPGVGEAGVLRELIASSVAGLRRAVRALVDAELRRREPRHAERVARQVLDDRPIAQLSPAEQASLAVEIQRLARRLAAKVPRPRPDLRRGRLDARATLRASWPTGGVPFHVRYLRKPVRRPRLIVLCDVSDSVRLVSRFMLALVHALARRYDRIHTFVFVADLGDATPLFRTRAAPRAIADVLGGAIVHPYQSSDYGRVLDQLAARHLGKITARTTVLILGDARTNHRDPRAGVLADVRRRAHRVVWLNPEPAAAWGWGDSAMHLYASHCHRAVTVWNLASLRRAIDEVVA